MTTQIYGREQCQQCDTTKAKFHIAKLPYEYLSYDDHEEALKEQFGQLPRSLPVIVNQDTVYAYNQLMPLIQTLKKAEAAKQEG